jgi:hypothetical protein
MGVDEIYRDKKDKSSRFTATRTPKASAGTVRPM